ncbi:outer-membrane lipoprotein carrier protein LolA [Dysgonomonas sp. Marseille-P4677]|uniref:LolA family protein n=1 Tax=Dysgonomonas sp. Marseille-P4677 TaxID=2364790 RepID=UPI001911F10E|nr:LolA-like putative outer membrane lipoprotein chaperone [Dysgonomonas sp. Marseille-P4677]MBK5719295.1 outer-membrane lipoprotein carrier protein LolA [Dysgonomonas sp. Marseille-P4677]
MRTKLFTLFILFAFNINISAQNARNILDRASETYNNAGAVTASFTLDTKDLKAKEKYSYDGKVSMKGNKFKIEIPDAITWFDGTTQWVYVKDTEEVNISNPTGEELQAISPSVLFSIYKKGFNLSYKGVKRINGKTVDEIELTPQKKGGDFSKIVVEIDQSNNLFSKISVTDKSGLLNVLTIRNYQKGVGIADSVFQFNKNEYPRAEIVDLR